MKKMMEELINIYLLTTMIIVENQNFRFEDIIFLCNFFWYSY